MPEADRSVPGFPDRANVTRNVDDEVAAVTAMPVVSTILDIICQTTGVGFAAVACVTEDRWVACGVRDDIAFGLVPGSELNVGTTICQEVRATRQAVVIDHVAADPSFRDHATPAMYGFQSYISMPILLLDGTFFGTLCAIDPRPLALNTPTVLGMFRLFADLIGFHLNSRERLATAEAQLTQEREIAQVREQFIAVLGHDLRNPLAAIGTGADLLLKTKLDAKGARLARLIRASAKRMSDLIDDVMDFARGRLGSGMGINRTNQPLEPVLRHVVAELQSRFPDRVIETDIRLNRPVPCDHVRVAQLLSNLLANAVTYGSADKPVRVHAMTGPASFTLTVVNGGGPIPPAIATRLFEPFVRGPDQTDRQGLGLGLFIAGEIARAHGGDLSADSSVAETRFTFQMPLDERTAPDVGGPDQ